MSTRKDKFSQKDIKYMELALNLARARDGLTGVNPSVGCVIVRNDEIISIGQTGYNGRPHAETNAIAKLAKSGESGLGAAMFVTHAPCIDCAKLVYQSGIDTVYYKNEYRSTQGLEFLTKSNVNLVKI